MESLDPTFGGLSQGAPAYPAVSSKVLWWEWEAGLPATLPHQSVPECRACTRRVPECRECTRRHWLEKEMARHSSVLVWRIPGMEAWWAAVCGVTESDTTGVT